MFCETCTIITRPFLKSNCVSTILTQSLQRWKCVYQHLLHSFPACENTCTIRLPSSMSHSKARVPYVMLPELGALLWHTQVFLVALVFLLGSEFSLRISHQNMAFPFHRNDCVMRSNRTQGWNLPYSAFTDIKTHFQNIYHPHSLSWSQKMCFYHLLTAFPEVKVRFLTCI